jgi:hypothetical protein
VFSANVSQRYIWQMDCFTLSLSFEHDIWHLHGSSRVGDNIEDEWFIVWILLQITAKFRNTTAAVSDSDGEFLLIEASHVIPSWLKPETAANRVFLRHGGVHVIPLPTHPADLLHLPLTCSLPVALNIMVTSNSCEDAGAVQGCTICTFNSAVDDVVSARLDDYPAKALSMARHVVRLRLPKAAAFLLRLCPQAVSPAVRAFTSETPPSSRRPRSSRLLVCLRGKIAASPWSNFLDAFMRWPPSSRSTRPKEWLYPMRPAGITRLLSLD